jgi:hypothetical protein
MKHEVINQSKTCPQRFLKHVFLNDELVPPKARPSSSRPGSGTGVLRTCGAVGRKTVGDKLLVEKADKL